MVPDQTASNPRFVAAEILAFVVVNTDRPTKIYKNTLRYPPNQVHTAHPC
jgi:hypothetical protein